LTELASLLTMDLFNHVLFDVKCVREFELVIDLNIAKLFEVKSNPVKMHDQRVWQVLDGNFLLNIGFLVA
jgi:hypothetical protein